MLRFFALCLCSLISCASWSKGIVVSNHPLYLIAERITAGIEQPELLLKGQSGHDATLTPLHRKKIQEASLIIWLGSQHEASLNKSLENNPLAISVVNSGIAQVLPQRDLKGNALKGTVDTHVWLDPNNAVRIGFFIAALRSQQNPQNKEQYWKNARDFAKDMLSAANKINQTNRSKAYWSFHDAYQYFERPLNLKFSGALTVDSHIAPTATQIKYLNDNRPMSKMCLLAEGHISENQYQKLGEIVFQNVDENMSTDTDFIAGWTKLANNVQNCIRSAQK